MSKEKQIEEISKILTEAAHKACEDIPFAPSDDVTCTRPTMECHRCKEARALIGAGYRKQEWISVEERLPETDNENRYTFNVLVYIPKRDGCRQHGIYIGKICRVKASDGKDNFWNITTQECEWTVWGWSYFEHPVVTHWMPLPEPPKMKGGAE